MNIFYSDFYPHYFTPVLFLTYVLCFLKKEAHLANTFLPYIFSLSSLLTKFGTFLFFNTLEKCLKYLFS